uniref:Lactase like n=1 Tax=Apteryx owenii TaxID=8824 RepID=A0A8B9QHP5_APTOW
HLGWFANPIYKGDYPEVMKNYVGRKSAQQGQGTSRLPTFSVQEKSYIKGTSDFLGIGHFTTRYVIQKSLPSLHVSSYDTDSDLAELVDPKWPAPGSEWLYSAPWGFRGLLNFIKTQYGNPLIYVTENGVSEKVQCTQLCDEWRIEYLKGYINEILKAINDGVNVKGYTAWSLLDKFEWNKGFSERFGFYHIDFKNKNKPRYPKASVEYYKKIISANGFPNPREVMITCLHTVSSFCIINKITVTMIKKYCFTYIYILLLLQLFLFISQNIIKRILINTQSKFGFCIIFY